MKIYWYNDKKNIIGPRVRQLRMAMVPPINQRQLAERLQLLGYEFDRATISRIELGDRFVPDYEVKALAEVLGVTLDELYKEPEKES